MSTISDWIVETLKIPLESQYKILYSLLTILALIVFRIVSIRLLLGNIDNIKDRYYWTRAIQYIYTAFALIIIAFIWFREFSSLGTVIGLISAALTISLKDLVINFAGWLFLLFRSPFKVGDRVQVGIHSGDVIDIRIFQFTINEIGNWVDADQSTGRIIHIPNGKIFTEAQANYDQGFSYIWNEINVLITFESNWKKSKELFEEVALRHAAQLSESVKRSLLETSKKYMILYNKLTPIVYTSVKESGVSLTLRYLIPPRNRRGSEQAMWEEILTIIGENEDINLAYPTQRIYYNPAEGSTQKADDPTPPRPN